MGGWDGCGPSGKGSAFHAGTRSAERAPSQGEGVQFPPHHRHQVGIRIGLSRLPVIKVDYLEDAGIELDVWPSCELTDLTKQQVIDMALSGNVYPPKTSRHRFSDHLPPIAVPLDLLRFDD